MARAIFTTNVCPPIPICEFDWMACWDGEQEYGPRGFGPTEQEAIDDLTANYSDPDKELAA